jgi:hypothetical protein
MRYFESGATRDSDDGKLDFEGFISPSVLWRFAEYMHTHRYQADGVVRDSDNWQKGIPQEAYKKSLHRHVMELWLRLREDSNDEDAIQNTLCAILFNTQGLLHERIKVGRAVPDNAKNVRVQDSDLKLRAHLGRGCGMAYDNLGSEGLLLDKDERQALWEKAHHPIVGIGSVPVSRVGSVYSGHN